MVRAAIGFFILAIVSVLFGLSGIAGISMDIAKMLIAVFLILATFSFLVSIFTGKRTPLP